MRVSRAAPCDARPRNSNTARVHTHARLQAQEDSDVFGAPLQLAADERAARQVGAGSDDDVGAGWDVLAASLAAAREAWPDFMAQLLAAGWRPDLGVFPQGTTRLVPLDAAEPAAVVAATAAE